ncbi:hypothetical protein K503DRAFT_282532 [Rhizopogon vinicolor AM-OR11-026]|uniref:Uncharacterized protein n=1 Tax=Rhizopogon vinicolor AM-OR11-026 TaxID=1314800 RepID=A0A1B7MVQ8_9AGAM|nr:hypothetical protein K503DRAFT_282532 [Rhizopogon vinicolor AM-OR11-026]
MCLYLILSFKHCIMVKYCGYLVGEDWLLQRGLDLGIESPETREDEIETILMASRNAGLVTDVYTYTSFRQVKTPNGKIFWCIAFASDDACDSKGLPSSRPPEENCEIC